MNAPDRVLFCPFCGSKQVKEVGAVPRCYGCNTVFFAYKSRTFKPRTPKNDSHDRPC